MMTGNPLPPMAEIVCVSTNVESAVISIAGQEVNENKCAEIYVNEALIEARAPGYLPYSQEVNLAEQGYNFEVELLSEPMIVGNPLPPMDLVCINATPKQSEIFINNNQMDNGTCVEVLYSSLVDVKIRADGYLGYQKSIQLDSQTLDLVIKLGIE